MTVRVRFSWLACPLVLAACGASPDPAVRASHGSTPAVGDQPVGEVSSGLQYSGAIATPTTTDRARLQLSAPLFPDMTVFQRFQGSGVYDATSATERLRLIDENVKTFDTLLTDCSPTHPNITLRASGDPPLTIDQLRTNYDEIANCGYQKYGAKPYWVPAYVSDIDICAQKLGPTWHLPSEADILGLTDADFQMFSDTMTALPGKDSFPVEWYYRLQVYVRAADGSLSLGDLGPASTHVSALPVPSAMLGELYLGNGNPIGLRCWQTGG